MQGKRRKDSKGRVLPEGVSERKDGRYIFRKTVNGVPIRLYAKNLNELKEKIEKTMTDKALGLNVDLGKMTLNEWFVQYINVYKKNHLKASTIKNYTNYYDWYIKAVGNLGNTKLKDIKRAKIIAHLNFLAEEKGLAKGTIRTIVSILDNCLEEARGNNAIINNPAKDAEQYIMGKEKEERDALEIEEVRVLIDFLLQDRYFKIYLPLLVVCMNTGGRIGEVLGLTWKDINFEENYMDLNHTLNYRDLGEGHVFFITTPKTKASSAKLDMTSEVVEMLKEQKQYQLDMRIRNDFEIDGYKDFVFTTKLGKPFTRESIARTLDNIVKKANAWEEQRAKEENRTPVVVRRHTPHYWRHTYCTRLLEGEVEAAKLKALMRHSNINTTLDVYAHVTEKIRKKNRERVEGLVGVLPDTNFKEKKRV